MKLNYDLEMEKELAKIANVKKMKLLIHSCCAPCSSSVLEYLQSFFIIDVFFYNPNITNENEYYSRLNEQVSFNKILGFNRNTIEGEYNPQLSFFEKIKGFENEKEGAERCKICYRIRMEETAKKAKKLGYNYFTTALSISPLKNVNWINEIGIELEKIYKVKFLKSDFKKKSRYLRSIELSKKYNLYRQDYCGCIFSKIEREKYDNVKNK